jgi:hypothetical protein
MRIRSALRVLPVLLGLSLLVLVPAARAAETLLLSCTRCDQLIATGSGLPANQTVRLTITDVKTGQQVGGAHSIVIDSQGLFVEKIPVDLSAHPSVESTVWKSDGQVMVVAAHNRFTAPCKAGHMGEMGGEMGEMGHETLAFTGSHAAQLLTLGATLLVLGAGLLLGTRLGTRRRLTR